MAENKLQETAGNVSKFIEEIEDEKKRQDAHQLIQLFSAETGCEPKLWGATIIGFGRYHYKYASGHEGDSLIIGFSPRKAEFSLYAVAPGHENTELIEQLGKFKMGKACIYFKKLSDLNIDVLEKLCLATIKHINEHHECGCRD